MANYIGPQLQRKTGRAPPTVCQSVILHFNSLPQGFIYLYIYVFLFLHLEVIKRHSGWCLRRVGFCEFQLATVEMATVTQSASFLRSPETGASLCQTLLWWGREKVSQSRKAEWQPKTQLERVGLQCHNTRQQISRHLASGRQLAVWVHEQVRHAEKATVTTISTRDIRTNAAVFLARYPFSRWGRH